MTRWDYKSVHKVALQFSSKREFERAYGGAYAWAKRHGVLEEITSHMKKHTLWDRESAFLEAKKYKNRFSFKKGAGGCMKWLERHDLLDEACCHMTPQFRWTFETVKAEAEKFDSRIEFQNGCCSAYEWAIRNNRIDDILPKSLKDWDYESVKTEALKYNKREDFRKLGAGASHWAARNGVWDDVCAHMEHQNKPVSLEEARREALRYKTRSAFYHNSPRAYAWALRNECLDDLCQHMESGCTASDSDTIYIWSPVGMGDVFKVGISSVRLADQRIRIVARAGNLDVDFYTIRHCPDARRVERKLLSIGRPYDWPQTFSGCTEFRQFESHEIDKAFSLIQPYEEASL